MNENRELKQGYFCIDNEVLDNHKLSFTAQAVYMHLARWAWKDNWAFSEKKFAEENKKGRSTISKAVNELVSAGLIVKSGKDINGRNIIKLCQIEKNEKQKACPDSIHAPSQDTPPCVTTDHTLACVEAPPALTEDTPCLEGIHKRKTVKQKNNKNIAEPCSDHHRLIALCVELHREARNEEPLINGGDGKAIKTLLGKYPPDIIEQKIRLLAKTGRPVTPRQLVYSWNNLEVKPQTGKYEFVGELKKPQPNLEIREKFKHWNNYRASA